ncbi:E3 ubiquitin--protein ligase, partial [Salmonella enterica subsp. enterica]|nr:E3 ubiquitin--protein ligase [Salmonella enterica subsp. enterica serovar Napoli]
NCQGYHETHRLTLDTAQGEECTGHAEGASGTLRTSLLPATTTPQTAAEYEAAWSEWKRAAPEGESRGRAEAVKRMRACLKKGNSVLYVGRVGLTTLPDLLPPNITTLFIPGNTLTRLPALPPGLRELSVSYNQLTSLPPLPPGLCKLSVFNNQLASLPALPSGLQILWAYRNRLTRLPALPPGLRELSVYRNQLTCLPESITGLSSEATVNLEGNPLSERTLQALRDITSAPGYSGPRIRFDMAGASAPREVRALHLAVADWLMPAREGEPAPADRWHVFGQEDNAADFSLFLDRLSETENFIKDAGFKAQ